MAAADDIASLLGKYLEVRRHRVSYSASSGIFVSVACLAARDARTRTQFFNACVVYLGLRTRSQSTRCRALGHRGLLVAGVMLRYQAVDM